MNTNILSAYGSTIRKIRQSQKISQERFADLCGLHRTYISDVELGKRNVSLENIEKMAVALNIKVSELFKEAENNDRF